VSGFGNYRPLTLFDSGERIRPVLAVQLYSLPIVFIW